MKVQYRGRGTADTDYPRLLKLKGFIMKRRRKPVDTVGIIVLVAVVVVCISAVYFMCLHAEQIVNNY